MPVTITLEKRHEPPPSTFRRFGVSGHAAAAGRVLGYEPDELAGLARRAAPYRDTAGRMATRRFRDIAFAINNDTITGVWRIPC